MYTLKGVSSVANFIAAYDDLIHETSQWKTHTHKHYDGLISLLKALCG